MEICDASQSQRGSSHQRLSAEDRSGHLARWKASGQSARVYGRLHGLEPWQLYGWQAAQKRRGLPRAEAAGSASARFLSLSLTPEGLSGPGATVTLRHGGLEFVVSGLRDPAEVAALLGAIRREVLDV